MVQAIFMQNSQGLQCCPCLKTSPPPTNSGDSQITVHFLHDNSFSQENHDKFVQIAEQYHQQIKFYNFEELLPKEVEKIRNCMTEYSLKMFSIYSGLKWFIPKVMPRDIKKVITIESDFLVNLDINELWQIDLGDKPLGAVPELTHAAKIWVAFCRDGIIKPEDYFNSGMILMNLEVLREKEDYITEKANFIFDNPQYGVCLDQDILNYCFSDDYLRLPIKFNCEVLRRRELGINTIGKNIYHFVGAGAHNPGMDMRDNHNKLFFEYFMKTPWFGVETFGNIFSAFSDFYSERQNLMVQLSAVMSGKKRAFFTYPHLAEQIKKFFMVKPDEKIIQANSNESLRELIRQMNKNKGKKIFFLFINDYHVCREILIKEGFVEGQDFLNVTMFLSPANGTPLESWQFVRRM